MTSRPNARTGSPSHDDVLRIDDHERSQLPSEPLHKSNVGVVDIAKMANVSAITVSRTLRNPDIVSESTRNRILEIVRQTGYVSHPHARALRTGHSSLVVAFISSMISPQYSIAMQKCSDVLAEHGYQLLIGLTSYSYLKEMSGISMLRAVKPAAVLFTGVIELESNRQALRDLDVPILESWAYPTDPIDMLVGFSNYDCGRMAAIYLHARQCHQVYFIGRKGGRGALRLKGFEAGARELGLTVKDIFLQDNVQSLYDSKNIYTRLKKNMSGNEGVFCANDILALGLHADMKSDATLRGKRPHMIGFGDLGYMSKTEPTLSIVGINSEALGNKAALMILNRLQGKKQNTMDYIPVHIYEAPA